MRRAEFALLACALAACGKSPSTTAGGRPPSAPPPSAATASAPAPASAPASPAAALELQRVADCFAAYRQSLLDQDGPRAASLVSQGTLALYQRLRDIALVGAEADVRALRLTDRLQVLLLRVRVPAAQLESMDGRALFAHTVTQNWIGKTGIQRASLGGIDVDPPRAVAKLLAGGKPTGESYHFELRDGTWSFDLLPSVEFVEQALRAQCEKLGIDEDAFVSSTIATLTGNQPDASLWKPLR